MSQLTALLLLLLKRKKTTYLCMLLANFAVNRKINVSLSYYSPAKTFPNKTLSLSMWQNVF